MKPIIKYQGGKSKEMPIILQFQPQNYDRIVEPFCGGAAVSLHFEKKCVLNDINPALINLYRIVGSTDYNLLQSKVDELKNIDVHNILEEEYYKSRDIINNPKNYSSLEYAFAYIVVRQMCFSGMERYNSSGMFNVPFGHYKKFSCRLGAEHNTFISNNAELFSKDAVEVINECDENDWLFLDPPYLDRLGYTRGDGKHDNLHNRLIEAIKNTKAKWLLIHVDCEYYRNNLSEYNITEEDFKYSQIFGKNKNHSSSKVKHIYIKNY
jgi:DNA adenine methylase